MYNWYTEKEEKLDNIKCSIKIRKDRKTLKVKNEQ